MNVLVTGGAGYIGSHTAWALEEQGHKVSIIDNLSTGQISSIKPSFNFYEGDVSEKQLLQKIIENDSIEAILHFAASIEVSESAAFPLKYYDNNTIKTIQLLKVCQESSINNFVFSSTAAVYGQQRDPVVSEDSPRKPISPYGLSKFMVEEVLTSIKNSSSCNPEFNFIGLRYFNVAGARVDGKLGQSYPNPSHLIHMAIEAALGKKNKLSIFGNDYPTKDGTCVRDFIHVQDLAQAHIDALNYLSEKKQSGFFNCGYSTGYSVLDVIQSVKKVTKADFNVEASERRPGDPSSLIADNKKITETLNWTPKHNDIDLICKTAYEWAISDINPLNS